MWIALLETARKIAPVKGTYCRLSEQMWKWLLCGQHSVNEESFFVAGPEMKPQTFNFGSKTGLHRGTLKIAGRNRPIRHLVAVSAALKSQADSGRIILKDSSPELILQGVANFHGLPLLPAWSGWLHERIQKEKRIQPLTGLNCDPIAITGTKQELLSWIGDGIKLRQIHIPSP